MKFQVRAATLLAMLVVSVSLAGCLVQKDKIPKTTYHRTTDNLRVYQNGDYINYNVQITRLPAGGQIETQNATLKIEWLSNTNLINPLLNTTSYQVLKERTTIDDNNGGGNLFTGVRYIQQNSATGAVKVVAIDDSGAERFWFNTAGDSDLSAVAPMTVFDSPLSFTGTSPSSPIGFYIIEGCATPPCTRQIAQFTDNIDLLGDTISITTNKGTFSDPLELQFNGTMIPVGDVPAPPVDFRYACSGGRKPASHDTRAYVFPEIGVIKMTNTCVETTDLGSSTEIYSLTLSSTNIPLPQL